MILDLLLFCQLCAWLCVFYVNCVSVPVCMAACVPVCVRACVHVCLWACLCAWLCVCVCARACVGVCVSKSRGNVAEFYLGFNYVAL